MEKIGEMSMENAKIINLYNLNETIAKDIFNGLIYPWEVLPKIKDFILELGEKLDKEEYEKVGSNVWIAKSAKVAPTAYINGPAIIDKNAEIRHCAFIRGNAIVGENAVVGNSTELKNVILFNNVQVPHYNYVGDSILGNYAHMGAGSICSNLKSGGGNITIHDGDTHYETGMRKIGALLGDHADIGCGSVLNPGTVIGKDSNVYPTSCVRGTIPEKCIWKNDGTVVAKK